MTDLLVVISVLLIVYTIVKYIKKQKNVGVKCVGCASGKTCIKKKQGHCH